MAYVIINGDVLTALRAMGDESVNCCITSPPYWGLRNYKLEPLVWGGAEGCRHEWGDQLPHGRRGNRGISGTGGNLYPSLDKSGQGAGAGTSGAFCSLCGAWRGSLGLEPTPELYTQHLVEIFREVRRVLRGDGTLWLNLGDSYASQGGAHGGREDNQTGVGAKRTHPAGGGDQNGRIAPSGFKPKDLIGVPWRVAFALQADGWWLRSDIIWHKPNPMPESVTDRPTKAHEYIFLLAKSERYYYDSAAIMEPLATNPKENYPARAKITGRGTQGAADARGNDRDKSGGFPCNGSRNRRSVWTIATQSYKGAHFATFPPALVEPMILAGCPPGGIVLDPFAGAGTTLLVAERLGRDSIGVEASPDYCGLAEKRIKEGK